MPKVTLQWFKASDGTPAVDMSVALVSQAISSPALGCYFQFVTPATGSPSGAYGLADSGDGVNFDTITLGSADQAPTQPTGNGVAQSTSITLPVGAWLAPTIRATYAPTSGGAGALPTGTFNAK
jgi:hypothetical protein